MLIISLNYIKSIPKDKNKMFIDTNDTIILYYSPINTGSLRPIPILMFECKNNPIMIHIVLKSTHMQPVFHINVSNHIFVFIYTFLKSLK